MARIKTFFQKTRNQVLFFLLVIILTYAYLARPVTYAWNVVLVENLAYVPAGIDGLYIVDVSNPKNPVRIGLFDSSGDVRAVFVGGKYAYLAAGRAGLRILNIENPKKPVEIGFVDTPGFAEDVIVKSNTAYVADGSRGLQVIDVRVPEFPGLIEASNIKGRITRLAVEENRLYMVDNGNLLKIVNITSPRAPEITNKNGQNVKETIYDIFPAKETVFLAAGSRGLVILNVADRQQAV